MPRVHHVKAARKDNPVAKKGEPYYWWKFRFGGKHYSKLPPRPSQLTQSAYLGAIYDLIEKVEDASISCVDDLESFRQEINGELQDIYGEAQDSLDNMPDSLQYSPTGELLQERIEACQGAESEIDCVAEFEFDEEDSDEDGYETDDEREADRKVHQDTEEERRQDEFESWVEEAKNEISEALSSCVI